MMGFTPPTVIDVIVVVSGTRYSYFEEVGILTNSCCTHESATRMAVNTHLFDVDKGVASSQLLDGIFMVGQWIVAHVTITKVVIPLRAAGVSTTLTNGNHDETGLRQAVGAHRHTCKRIGSSLYLWTWVNIIHNRINLGRIEVEWFVHHTVKVGHTIGSLHLEWFWEFIAGGKELREVALL